jgi:hypothetical protein
VTPSRVCIALGRVGLLALLVGILMVLTATCFGPTRTVGTLIASLGSILGAATIVVSRRGRSRGGVVLGIVQLAGLILVFIVAGGRAISCGISNF